MGGGSAASGTDHVPPLTLTLTLPLTLTLTLPLTLALTLIFITDQVYRNAKGRKVIRVGDQEVKWLGLGLGLGLRLG